MHFSNPNYMLYMATVFFLLGRVMLVSCGEDLVAATELAM
jgi:hypothetical protein